MMINLDLTEDQDRVLPINVGGHLVGYLVLTLNRLMDGAGRAGDHNECAPTLPCAPIAELIEPLTTREEEVLDLIIDGLSNQGIADRLFLSIGTVKAYTSVIYRKLGVNSRTQAVAQARRLNLFVSTRRPLPHPSLENQPSNAPSSVVVQGGFA